MEISKKYFKIIQHVCKTILVFGIATFIFLLLGGIADVSAQNIVQQQFQGHQQQALITHVDKTKTSIINRLIKIDIGKLIFSNQTRAEFQKFDTLLNNRQQNQRQINQYYDGKYYSKLVTTKKLDHTDRRLLLEHNQTVYQRQKNRLDTIRIWFDQTQDANKFLNKTFATFQANHDQLDVTQVSQANAYYKLIKNRYWQLYWQPRIRQILNYFKKAQSNKDKNQLAQEKAQLEALKNAPLTQDYLPAQVTIINNVQVADAANQYLKAAGITANNVLYFDQDEQTLSLLHRSNGQYKTTTSLIRVKDSQIISGIYYIRSIIVDPDATAGVVTDRTKTNFGRYYPDATTIDSTTNMISDYNRARPTFWLKNNSALQTSILFGNSRNIGFIYSSTSALNNGLTVTNSDLITLTNIINSGTLLYVN